MKRLIILAALFSALQCSASIAFVNQNSATATSGAITVSLSTTGGNCATIFTSVVSGSSRTISSLTDTGGTVYSQLVTKINTTNAQGFLWGACNIKASTAFTVTLDGIYTNAAVGVAQYSGAGSFGLTNNATLTSAGPSVSIGGAAGTSRSVAGITAVGSGTFTAATGNLRESTATGVGQAIVDNTGSNTTSATLSGSEAWAAMSVELVIASPTTSQRRPIAF